jgi:membrane protein implicated in regulation of membrane protease activity
METLSGIIVSLFVVWALANLLSLPFGSAFLWIQKRLGFPRNIRTGPEALIGELATIVQPFIQQEDTGQWKGKVRLRSEIWSAKLKPTVTNSKANLKVVRVDSIEGLTLVVTPADED